MLFLTFLPPNLLFSAASAATFGKAAEAAEKAIPDESAAKSESNCYECPTLDKLYGKQSVYDYLLNDRMQDDSIKRNKENNPIEY